MKSLFTYITMISVLLGVSITCGAAPPRVYAQLQAASVEILVNGRLAGSGSVVDSQGHVLIANHMAPGGGVRIEAQSKSLGRHALKIVARDKAHDLMLLVLPPRKEGYSHLTLAKDQPKAGQPVFLFGAPVFRHEVMISGTMARSQPTYEFYDGAFREIFHISAIAPIGTSGGPWVNGRGELIGVQSAAMTVNGAHQGIAYASPLASLKGLLKQKQTIQSATLQTGVEELWGQEPGFIKKLPKDFSGLVVRQLQANGVAAKAGLKEWDIIVAVVGKPVDRTDELINFIRSQKPGQSVEIKATDREGKNVRKLSIKLVPLQ
tara:strand:+ start:675 stop:1634 length:960 start_codon:yes stop_codon:yes gene_type:complete